MFVWWCVVVYDRGGGQCVFDGERDSVCLAGGDGRKDSGYAGG